jgi:phenylpropionate dioxygenase-like ring-hydroxylating dioxygenase large terminal subunit
MPGYSTNEPVDAVRLERFAARERDGLVWISSRGDNPLPERIQALDASNRRFLWQSRWAASVIDIQENFLDALHTHFVHPGLVRKTDRRKLVNVTLRTTGDGFHVDYSGQPEQSGLIFKLFESRRTRERAYLSALSTAQLEYQYARNRTVWITLCCTPMAEASTHIFGMLHVNGRWAPSWLIRLLVWPFIRRVARQDQNIVEHQQRQRSEFSSHRDLIMPLDIVRPYLQHAWASQNHPCPLPEEVKRTISL